MKDKKNWSIVDGRKLIERGNKQWKKRKRWSRKTHRGKGTGMKIKLTPPPYTQKEVSEVWQTEKEKRSGNKTKWAGNDESKMKMNFLKIIKIVKIRKKEK